MKHFIQQHCPHCNGGDIVKNGRRSNGTQRWLCNICKKSFQFEYKTIGKSLGIKDKIDSMLLNGSGTRDICRVLDISKKMISDHIKKKSSQSKSLFT